MSSFLYIAQQSKIANSTKRTVTPPENKVSTDDSLAHMSEKTPSISARLALTIEKTNAVAATLGKRPRHFIEKNLIKANTVRNAIMTATSFAQSTITPSMYIIMDSVSNISLVCALPREHNLNIYNILSIYIHIVNNKLRFAHRHPIKRANTSFCLTCETQKSITIQSTG